MSLLITRGLGPAVGRVVYQEVVRYIEVPTVEVDARFVKKREKKEVRVEAKWIASRSAQLSRQR